MFTCAKLVAIGIICIGGAYKFSTGESATKDFGFSDTIMSPGILAMAFYSASWYDILIYNCSLVKNILVEASNMLLL